MGRRSQHTPDELRTLIVDAAQRIVEAGGVLKLSAREIARAIGYAPGTLYNMFENLDEILLRVEVRMLQRLDQELESCLSGVTGAVAVRHYTTTYVAFAHARPRLWSLLNEHQLTGDVSLPEWYIEALLAPTMRLEEPLAAVLDTRDEAALRTKARTLWRLIHGVTLLSTCTKLGPIEARDAEAQMKDLVDNYLTGLVANQGKRSAAMRGTKDRVASSR